VVAAGLAENVAYRQLAAKLRRYLAATWPLAPLGGNRQQSDP
jgi:hypothetical protein